MNTMTHALKDAGVKIPTVDRRIHHWLKDHPGKTYQEIAAALGLLPTTTQATTSNMYREGYLTMTKDKKPSSNFFGYVMVNRYSVVSQDYDGFDYGRRSRRLKERKAIKQGPFTVVPQKPAPAPTSESTKPKHKGRPRTATELNRQTVNLPPDVIELVFKAQDKFEDATGLTPTQSQIIMVALKEYLK